MSLEEAWRNSQTERSGNRIRGENHQRAGAYLTRIYDFLKD
jgi:hypothetical protein